MVLIAGILIGIYFAVGFAYYKHNRLTADLIDDLVKHNELIAEQNTLLRGIIKKYGLDI